MNYLAHIYLAEGSEESVLGNLMGDFVKGAIGNNYEPEIEKGIWTHRKIDVFTDSHEKFKASKKLMSPERRRFAGIIIDLAFDHFLAKNWLYYSDTELDRFIQKKYELLSKHKPMLPEQMRHFLPRMIEEDWLGSYCTLEGTGVAIDRTSRRLKRRFNRENTLTGAIEEVETNYMELESNFKAFFPQLISYVEDLRSAGIHEPELSMLGNSRR
ncbi:MAG: ACP phosphodiesterase [Thermodesulfobacteriota bacterium]